MRHVSAQKHCWWAREKIFFAPLRRRWIYDDPSEWVATICWEIVEHSFGLTRLRNLFAFVYLFLSRLERKMCEELANRRKRQRAKIVWSTIERCWNMWSIHMRPREINEKVVSRVNSYFRLFNWLYLPVNSMVQACCTWIPLARKIGEIRCVAKSRKSLSINMWNLTYLHAMFSETIGMPMKVFNFTRRGALEVARLPRSRNLSSNAFREFMEKVKTDVETQIHKHASRRWSRWMTGLERRVIDTNSIAAEHQV